GLMGGGGFGGFGTPGFVAPAVAAPAYTTPGFEGQEFSQGFGQGFVPGSPVSFGSFGGAGMGGFDASQMMAMIPQLVSLADTGGGRHHRKKRHHRRSAP